MADVNRDSSGPLQQSFVNGVSSGLQATAVDMMVPHSLTHPRFLNSNSTSHSWAFGAVAELVDNAQDPDVMADQLSIDVQEVDGHKALMFSDNGLGLDRAGLHKMLSFGHSDKERCEPGRHQAVGRYGNGFKSGSMRLGEDALRAEAGSALQKPRRQRGGIQGEPTSGCGGGRDEFGA